MQSLWLGRGKALGGLGRQPRADREAGILREAVSPREKVLALHPKPGKGPKGQPSLLLSHRSLEGVGELALRPRKGAWREPIPSVVQGWPGWAGSPGMGRCWKQDRRNVSGCGFFPFSPGPAVWAWQSGL